MKQKAKMSKPWLAAFILLSGMAIFTSCEKYSWVIETVDPEVPVLFQTEVQPIFTAKCISCHKGTRNPDLRDGIFTCLTYRWWVCNHFRLKQASFINS